MIEISEKVTAISHTDLTIHHVEIKVTSQISWGMHGQPPMCFHRHIELTAVNEAVNHHKDCKGHHKHKMHISNEKQNFDQVAQH